MAKARSGKRHSGSRRARNRRGRAAKGMIIGAFLSGSAMAPLASAPPASADWLDLIPCDSRPTEPGFQVASALLDTLVARGCVLDHDWVDREGGKVAALTGPIPVEVVLAYLSTPAQHIPQINMLEVRPDGIRIAGLAFEEYRIESH